MTADGFAADLGERALIGLHRVHAWAYWALRARQMRRWRESFGRGVVCAGKSLTGAVSTAMRCDSAQNEPGFFLAQHLVGTDAAYVESDAGVWNLDLSDGLGRDLMGDDDVVVR